jgi:hypothetical protein
MSLAPAPVMADSTGATITKPADEFSAQQRRARTRIEVRPLRSYRSPPGPNYVRQCTSWLQPEYRPSGPVITPQMRCWWVRG